MIIPGMRGRWHRLWSMRFIIVTTFLSSAMVGFAAMPPEWQADIPGWLVKICAMLTFVSAGLAGVARVIQQPVIRDEIIQDKIQDQARKDDQQC